MSETVRTMDWSRTPLGPMNGWPQALRSAVDICLSSRFPMFIWWGPHLINLYNDAYVPVLGSRHPDALGQPAPAVWAEVWPFIEPQVEAVMARGEASWHERVPLILERNGYSEEAFFTWSYSPIRDGDDGRVGGLLCVVTEETGRVRTEAMLADARRRLDSALIAGEVGTFEWDVLTDRLWGDRNFARIFSITLDETGAAPLADYVAAIHAEDRERVVALVQQTLETKSGYEAEYRITSGGRMRWVVARGKVELDDAGRVVRFPGVVVDVTGRKQAEEALRASEERFRAAFEHAAVGIGHVGFDGRWLRVNQKLCDIVGYTHEELVELTFQNVTHPDDLPDDLDNLRRLLAGETRTYASEKRYLRKDGGSVWVSLTISVVGSVGDPDSAYFVTVVEDISARKAAEQRLREESEVVETISRVGRALAAELDTQKLIQTITDATTNLTGAQFGAFFHNTTDDKGQALWLYTVSGAPREAFDKFPLPRGTHLFGPTLRGEGVVRIADVLKDARYGRNAPYSGMPPGHLPVRSYLAASVVSRSGEVLGGLFFGHPEVGVFSERAERIVTGVASQAAVALDNARLFEAARKANEAKDALLASEQAARSEAERVSRMKDEFLATLSHELRTPLNAILGWATILKHGGSGEEDMAQGLETIERNARAQTQIIEDLLDMSRIISGKVRLDVQRVGLEPILRAAVDTVTPAANAKGVRMQAVLDPLAGPVSGDPARLQQIFWNLLTNAIKFTPRGGRIQVVLERVNSHLEISVIDSGEGIKPEFLPHVFDRFRQADATTTRQHGGLGLGLSIVKQLVELHGGSVRAKSMGVGHGSTFTVSLPLAVIHADPTLDADRRHPTEGGDAPALVPDLCAEIAGVRVLVVDDEPDARALVKRLLEDCGAVVSTAASAAEAMETLQAERPDVLVSDIGMPTEDGYSFIRRVRALGKDRGGNVPAVALTAYARAEDRMRSIRAGFQMHVPKPVEPAELITMVASLAGRG